MDKGNHFYKCDLQVHSPRDRGWNGNPAVTEEERSQYAKEFVADCREAGLQAIAISDHHDLVFFEYIKEASRNERYSDGDLYKEEERLVVFPAVELTFHTPPIQGIVILDANFPEHLFPTLLGALGIAQAAKTESKTIETSGVSQETIANLNALHHKLDETDGVKGRYIFLPHVKEKGHKTLMREGFHDSYARMPCVGGYVDGRHEGGGVGYLKILNGEVAAWGSKSLAVIQTSDFRGKSKIKDEGVSTWIKWSKPTAEALRQACLAKESRISLVDPEVPNIFIEKVDVTASAFMGKFTLDLNPQLNSIIGGRGTGKSTILEYIRWALCDQTEEFDQDEEKSEILRRRNVLIEKTLGEHSGEVRIFFNVNGTRHIIKRVTSSEDVQLKIGSGEFQSVRPSQIKELLPIQAYSQKQLSSVAVRPDELKRFIEQPISKDIEEYDTKLEELSTKVKTSYGNLSRTKQLNSKIDGYSLNLKSYKEQITKLRGDLKGMSEEDKKVIERAPLFSNEANRITEIELEYKTIEDKLEGLKRLTSAYSIQVPEVQKYENEDLIREMEAKRLSFLKELSKEVETWLEKKKTSLSEIQLIKKKWLEIKGAFDLLYAKSKEKSTSSEQTLASIKELEAKIAGLESLMLKSKSEQSGISVSDSDFKIIYQEFINCQKEKTEKLKDATALFTKLSDGFIKADFTNIIDSEQLALDINNIFSSNSLSIPKTRAEQLCTSISDDESPTQKWHDTVHELKTLIEFSLTQESKNELPHTPILDSAGFTTANKRKISEVLTAEPFLNLALIRMEYLPKFHYQTSNEMGDEIPFEDASAGQQATALLNVLLNQDGYPLIIDQPEDDIDNRAIDKIIRNLWYSKRKRQIIISSHNANLVVNGDSELVVCCDYNESSDQTKGYIKHQGSIDFDEIRDEITSVMEGGERAFKLRKEKYGY